MAENSETKSSTESEIMQVSRILMAEVENNLQQPFYCSLRRLYQLFNLKYPKNDETEFQVSALWNLNLRRPQVKDFPIQWIQANQPGEKEGVKYRFQHWYREIKLLERIAQVEGWTLERLDENLGCKCYSDTCQTCNTNAYGVHRSPSRQSPSTHGFLRGCLSHDQEYDEWYCFVIYDKVSIEFPQCGY